MTRTKMSDSTHDVRTKPHSDRIYGQLQDICTGVYAPERINEEYTPQGIMSTQVGGDWYSKLAIQPGEYAMANNFNYWQSHALPYLTRYKDKGGRQDLEKAIDCIRKLIEAEYGPETGSRP